MNRKSRISRSVSPLPSSNINHLNNNKIYNHRAQVIDFDNEVYSDINPYLKFHYHQIINLSENSESEGYIEKFEHYERINNQRRLRSDETFCNNCVSLRKNFQNYKFQQKNDNNKSVLTEKHLKQYEDLLKIKDSRLIQKELALNNQQNQLENEKKRLTNEKNSVLFERNKLDAENKILQRKITENNAKISLMLRIQKEKLNNSLNQKECKSSSENSVNEGFFLNNEIYNNKPKKHFCETKLDEFEELELSPIKTKLKEKKRKLKQKEEELKKQDINFNQYKRTIEKEIEHKKEENNEKEMELIIKDKLLNELQKKLNEDQKLINEEFQSVEELKSILNTQREILESERIFNQENYAIKLAELENNKSSPKLRLSHHDSPLKYSQETIQEINVDTYDELSFGRIDYSACSDIARENESKCNSIQDKGFEPRRKSIEEKICESRDTLTYGLDTYENHYKSTYVSTDDTEALYCYKQRISYLEKVIANLESKIFEIEKKLKLADLFYMQDQ